MQVACRGFLAGLPFPPWRKNDPISVDDQSLFFRQIVDSFPALLHTALPDGYIDFFNRTWLVFTGRLLEKLLGWGWTSSIHVEVFVAKMREFLCQGRAPSGNTASAKSRWCLSVDVAPQSSAI
jgi:hypothetical protein